MVNNPFHLTKNPFDVNEEDEVECKETDQEPSDKGGDVTNASALFGLDSSAISVEDGGRNNKSAHYSLGI